MGVSGSGKTSVGTAAAHLAGVRFIEGDDLHPPGNVAAMLAGQPIEKPIERRMAERSDHFIPVSLLDSQLATLEASAPREGVVMLDAARSIDNLAAAVAVLAAPRVG